MEIKTKVNKPVNIEKNLRPGSRDLLITISHIIEENISDKCFTVWCGKSQRNTVKVLCKKLPPRMSQFLLHYNKIGKGFFLAKMGK